MAWSIELPVVMKRAHTHRQMGLVVWVALSWFCFTQARLNTRVDHGLERALVYARALFFEANCLSSNSLARCSCLNEAWRPDLSN